MELKPSKTRISHTLNKYGDFAGFDFLGFNVRQYPVGKHHTGYHNGYPLGFKTLIKPSIKKLKIHTDKIGKVIDTHKTAPQKALIGHLNPIIRGWANYYSTVVSSDTFSQADTNTYSQLKRWAERRHPKKSNGWVTKKYWHTVDDNNWCFSTDDGEKLLLHQETSIVRHIKVQANKSPYDGDWVYWSERLTKYPGVTTKVMTLLKKQKGKCSHCNLHFREGDVMEVHHKDKNRSNNKYQNLELLHGHCHDQIHSYRLAEEFSLLEE